MKDLSYSPEFILISLLLATVLILGGTVLRHLVPLLQKLHLPAAVVGGLLGLIIGPQVLGQYWIAPLGLEEEVNDIYKIWKMLPGYLISIVFAALMMGKKLPTLKTIADSSTPHLVVGYSIAWGQYVVGIGITMLVLLPFLGANPLNSALIAIGFQGGYGTAAGLGSTYTQLGFSEGYDLALGMATAGKVSAILVGLILINMAVRFQQMKSPDDTKKDHLREDVSEIQGKKAVRKQRVEMHFSADRFIIHCAILCVAVILGWAIRESLFFIESFFIENEIDGVVQYIPLFPMALLGGIVLQAFITAIRKDHMVNERHIHSISHSFLDLLIIVAIATLSLKTIIANWQLLLLLIATGIGWNLLMFFFIAPRFYKDAPWVRGVGDFAHATGAATTGLLLMKVIDPNNKTGARSSFNLKQPFYEPIVGGGFITALALPLMHTAGVWITFAIAASFFFVTLLIGYQVLGVNRKNTLFIKGDDAEEG